LPPPRIELQFAKHNSAAAAAAAVVTAGSSASQLGAMSACRSVTKFLSHWRHLQT
jgi:hypothetical protein